MNRELQQHRGWVTLVHHRESWECGAEKKTEKRFHPEMWFEKTYMNAIPVWHWWVQKWTLYPVSSSFKKSGERPQGCTKHGGMEIF